MAIFFILKISMIKIKNISKRFYTSGQTVTALQDVSMSIEEGKIFGIIGKSGAGKSTLIRCINLLEVPDEGEVWVDGVNLMALSQSELTLKRRKMGMIFQHFNLLSSRTIFQNVAFPLELMNYSKEEIRKKVLDLLEIVGILDKADQYPSSLSGGQKQRVAIARALANDPTLLLCDEATSALDPTTTKSILKLLKKINEQLKITIVLITHEMDVITSICDEVAVMKNGLLVEHGTVESIFTNPKENVTKKFIRKSLDMELPSFYQNQLNVLSTNSTTVIYKLQFTNVTNYLSILQTIDTDYTISVEIINSKIDYAGTINFGIMFIKVAYSNLDQANIVESLLIDNKFNIEKIGYV